MYVRTYVPRTELFTSHWQEKIFTWAKRVVNVYEMGGLRSIHYDDPIVANSCCSTLGQTSIKCEGHSSSNNIFSRGQAKVLFDRK